MTEAITLLASFQINTPPDSTRLPISDYMNRVEGLWVDPPTSSQGIAWKEWRPIWIRGEVPFWDVPVAIKCRCGLVTTFGVGEFPEQTTVCRNCDQALVVYS